MEHPVQMPAHLLISPLTSQLFGGEGGDKLRVERPDQRKVHRWTGRRCRRCINNEGGSLAHLERHTTSSTTAVVVKPSLGIVRCLDDGPIYKRLHQAASRKTSADCARAAPRCITSVCALDSGAPTGSKRSPLPPNSAIPSD